MKRFFVTAGILIAALGGSAAYADMPASDVASFEALDKNKDGALKGEEAKVVEAVGEKPAVVDADDDGRLDKAEFEAAVSGQTGTEVGVEGVNATAEAEEAEEEAAE
jgi:hypothetical protein